MKVVIQRVSEASVLIDGLETRSIGQGLMILLGITHDDTQEDIEWLSKKIVQMRIFPDDEGVMNKSILESAGNILLISQFTLHASTKKGNRPSYINAARPEIAIPLYEQFINQLQTDLGKNIYTGKFGADMKVSLVNDGPVTIVVDSKMKE
ncbi:MAG TPA: D-aminoacyl-tRNA deacylase [Bacteroidia bacterium]|jgi:D-tyrosyl-tRNA(Tyr) deacylase|nr:D-aminoacyl-tRNA deacylase [Bacteroidia bacterium]HQF29542.1 D-aminoacyl-tRNA deacylase [Bacteroidia bacterium]HQK98084.1 D-aminoacyl-tRNA deacylase [Bacteroidia bacterium]